MISPVQSAIGFDCRCALLFLVWSVAAGEPIARASEAGGVDDDQRRPNVVFILTDDLRWDALGCTGNELIGTPHIDRLARDGLRLTNMFCTTSICATSRASFLTGQWARRHGVYDFRTPLTPHQLSQTFPLLLRDHGYRIGFVGKWGLGGELPEDAYDFFRGFSGQGRYFAENAEERTTVHLTHRLGDDALDFLATCRTGEPFLLQLSTKAAHVQDGDPWPFQPDPRYASLLRDATVPRPVTATPADFRALPEFLRQSEARRRWSTRFATAPMFQKSVKDYYRLIAGVDDVVGRLVERLDQMGVANNTVIIFTSDNGFFLGEHGLAGKWFMREESIRLPLILYDPHLPEHRRGSTISKMALSVDVAPTVLDRCGIEIPQEAQGRSLVPLMRGKEPRWREDFFYEHLFDHPRIPMTEGVRGTRWKYTRYVSVEPIYEELFDLAADPHEQRNLAGRPHVSEKLQALRDRCDELATALQ